MRPFSSASRCEPALCGLALLGHKVFWAMRPLDNPLFGLLFTVLHRRYRTEGFEFDYPRALVELGFRSVFFFDLHERDERELVREHLRPGDRVLELGGGIGVLACLTNRILGDEPVHVVVEADSRLLPYLAANRDRNGRKFTIVAGAVADGDGVAFLAGPSITTGRCDAGEGPVTVRARSLSDLHREHGQFTVLIMDIEGGELEFLRAFGAELGGYRLILVELHEALLGDAGSAECRSRIEAAGFALRETRYGVEVYERICGFSKAARGRRRRPGAARPPTVELGSPNCG